MKRLLTILVLAITSYTHAQTVGIFNRQVNVGNPKLKGTASFDKQKAQYKLSGAGYNIWFDKDEFFFLGNEITGDFKCTAKFRFPEKGKNAHRKIGWMVRESLDADAAHATATIHGDSLTVLQWRTAKGAKMRDPEDELFYKPKGNVLLTLERKGSSISMWAAREGAEPALVGSTTAVQLPQTAFVGIFICSHDPDVIEKAEVWDVTINSD